ncbi:CzcE family metal-binding protein [Rhizobacter sp. LjRoot28]|uniref:CzcE family metal-binding protein n=1 Tax=Rhizobacter sp. LjRoot28 TaxID=3342309 RepID=UPI003ECCD95A
MNSKYVLNIAAGATLLVSGATFAAGDSYISGKSLYGQPARETTGAKLVDVAQAGKLNVRCGDTVTFVNGDKKFSWKFDVASHRVVPLTKIAPADFGGKLGTVYVSPNESERGRS